MTQPRRAESRLRRIARDPRTWLAALVLVVAAAPVHELRAQQASRAALTAAVWEKHALEIDGYPVGVDRVIWRGHTYSDKAPGQSIALVPFYGMYRLVGGESLAVYRTEGNLGVWWLTVWGSAVPLAVLAVLIFDALRERTPVVALRATLTTVFSTMLLPFGALLFGHVLAALLIFAAVRLWDRSARADRLFLVGLLLGAAVLVEYPAAIAATLVVLLSFSRGPRAVGWIVLGGLAPALLLAGYNTVAFGGWHILSYDVTAFSEVATEERDVVGGLRYRGWRHVLEMLFGPRGIVVTTPAVTLGVVGALSRPVRAWGRSHIGLIIFAGFWIFASSVGHPWGGDSPGVRYVVPALPLLAAGIAEAFDRWPRLTRFAAGVGGMFMLAATFTDPLLPRNDPTAGPGVWIVRLLRRDVVDTIFTLSVGTAGWIVHGLVILIVAVGLSRSWRAELRVAASPAGSRAA